MIETQLIGNLGQDSEVRTLDSGMKLLSFSVAVTETYKDKSGEKKEKTTWVNCTQWDIKESRLFEYLKKGQQVWVKGEPSARAWLNKDGGAVGALELRVLGVKLLGNKAAATPTVADPTPAAKPAPAPVAEDDDVPF